MIDQYSLNLYINFGISLHQDCGIFYLFASANSSSIVKMSDRYDLDEHVHVPDDIAVDNEHIQEIARYYILNHLRREGFGDIADQIEPARTPNNRAYSVIERIVNQLEDERAQQFVDILTGLNIDRHNLRITYNTVVSEIFSDGVHWGRIVAFLVFSGHLAIHCARSDLKEYVPDVVSWAELEMRLRIHQWVQSQGGWQAFVRHFNRVDNSWVTSLSTAAVTVGMVAALFAAGFLTVRRFMT